MNERFKIKAINDEESSCMCCGKSGLQKVVWIEDTETGDIQHFGCICALKPSKAFGIKEDDLKSYETAWKTILAIRNSKARRMYREAGGVMKMVTPYSAAPANLELWQECQKKAA
jgi:hypothetical protein